MLFSSLISSKLLLRRSAWVLLASFIWIRPKVALSLVLWSGFSLFPLGKFSKATSLPLGYWNWFMCTLDSRLGS